MIINYEGINMDFFNALEKAGIIYNDSQKKAISHVNGPLLVAAGPGSGKTTVIAARCAYLIKKAKVDPSSILVITFTKAAALEMQSRFASFPLLSEGQYKKVEFGTFHSTFYRIINSYYGRNLRVLEPRKAFEIIRGILKYMNEPYDDELIQNTINDISLARTVSGNESCKSGHYNSSKFLYILNEYERQKKLLKSIDFDDMMVMCKNLLEKEQRLLSYWKDRFKYFMIDEFQDSNSMQFEIVKMLCSPLNNICVVGDDDQSIYSFRGAIPDCLRNFETEFQGSNAVTLDVNYRSTADIVDFSEKIICANSIRKEKHQKSAAGYGTPPVLVSPYDENSEAQFVADTIERMNLMGLKYGSFAVLYRINIQSRPLIDEFIKRGIPFNVRDSGGNFFDHWVCSDITCYLNLSVNGIEPEGIMRIINRPVRFIPKNIFNTQIYSKGKFDIAGIAKDSHLKYYQIENVKKLEEDIKSIKSMSPSHAVAYIRKNVGYDDYIRKYCSDMDMKPDELMGILDEYEEAAHGFDTIPFLLSHIKEVSQKLKENAENKNTKITDSVTLSTIHGAKGLEFECVFVIGLVEGLLPYKKSIITGEGIEEERRLFYVAATRAKRYLYISSCKKHRGSSANVSRFINDMDSRGDNSKYIAQLMPGMLIKHSIFGTGTVKKVSAGTADIHFITSGYRKVDIKTCIENRLLEFTNKLH